MAVILPIISEFNAKGTQKAIKEFQSLEGAGKKAQFALKKAALPAALALGAVTAAASGMLKAGEAAATSNARIAQINESMGLFGAETEKVNDRLFAYANATARATGIDQNSIKATQAKLLTFGALAKSADELNGAFDRATTAAIDLASAGFGDAESNAVQLGKALQDPIKGIAALAKSGVSFTEQEKEKIKTLVETNRTLEAQDLILKAIEKQVGGTALATANDTDKLKVAFSQVSESIGLILVPILGWPSTNTYDHRGSWLTERKDLCHRCRCHRSGSGNDSGS
jgi:small-conductance mechanosensitive channel